MGLDADHAVPKKQDTGKLWRSGRESSIDLAMAFEIVRVQDSRLCSKVRFGYL